MKPRVIFLDIDGVLLPRRAWLTPANLAVLDAEGRQPGDARRNRQAAVTFDPLAVELVNRLARRASAQVVVLSNWRHTFGSRETVQKLVGQGLDAALFHADPCCPITRPDRDEKATDMHEWLHEHRTTPKPKRPDYLTADNAERDDYHRALFGYGVDFVVLDDEFRHDRAIAVDPDEGLLLSDYRVALRALGGLDPLVGIKPLPEGIWERCMAAHGGNAVYAASWLDRPRKEDGMTRWQRSALREDYLEAELAALEAEAARPDDEAPFDNDF